MYMQQASVGIGSTELEVRAVDKVMHLGKEVKVRLFIISCCSHIFHYTPRMAMLVNINGRV